MSILEDILRTGYIDPELLDALDDEQKQLLFCQMRQEQLRRWRDYEQLCEDEERTKSRNPKPGVVNDGHQQPPQKRGVKWLLGGDGEVWVWVMGDYPGDRSIEQILEDEAREEAHQLACRELSVPDSSAAAAAATAAAAAVADDEERLLKLQLRDLRLSPTALPSDSTYDDTAIFGNGSLLRNFDDDQPPLLFRPSMLPSIATTLNATSRRTPSPVSQNGGSTGWRNVPITVAARTNGTTNSMRTAVVSSYDAPAVQKAVLSAGAVPQQASIVDFPFADESPTRALRATGQTANVSSQQQLHPFSNGGPSTSAAVAALSVSSGYGSDGSWNTAAAAPSSNSLSLHGTPSARRITTTLSTRPSATVAPSTSDVPQSTTLPPSQQHPTPERDSAAKESEDDDDPFAGILEASGLNQLATWGVPPTPSITAFSNLFSTSPSTASYSNSSRVRSDDDAEPVVLRRFPENGDAKKSNGNGTPRLEDDRAESPVADLKRREREIFRSLQERREQLRREAEAEDERRRVDWEQQERRARAASGVLREMAARAREQLRRSQQDELQPIQQEVRTSDSLLPALADGRSLSLRDAIKRLPRPPKPKSRDAIVSWFRRNELLSAKLFDSNGRISVWFHGIISRDEADDLLADRPVGSFLVRVSERIWGYTVSYVVGEGVEGGPTKHFLVERIPQGYQFLGTNQLVHASLADLVQCHRSMPITLRGGELLRFEVGQSSSAVRPDFADLLSDA